MERHGRARPRIYHAAVNQDRAARREVERWLVARGVPQVLTGYGDEQRLDARATPLIAGWLALGTVLWWATRPDWPLAWNVVAAGLSLIFMAVAYAAVSLVRGRRPLERPRRWDLLDIATFGVLPAVPAAVVHGPLQAAITIGNALLGIGFIYLLTRFGVPEIAGWATRRIGSELDHVVRLISRTLPLLLILVVFLLFAAELWEAAHSLNGSEIALVVGLLLIVGSLLILTTLQSELTRIEARVDWPTLAEDVRDTPAVALVDRVPPNAPPPPRFTWLERANLSLLILLSQLFQSIFVGLVVAAFLVMFGLIAIPAAVQESWIGESVSVVARFELLGEDRTLSLEMLAVVTLLGGIIGLYFTGLALTDAAYRSEYFSRVIAEVQQIAAVRAFYLADSAEATEASPQGR